MIKLFCSWSALARVSASVLARSRCATYDEGADGAEGSDALAGAVVELNLYEIRLGLCQCQWCLQSAVSDPTYVGEADRQVAERLCELALRGVRNFPSTSDCVRLTRGPAES
jgi:hypothetical protein